MDLTNVDNRKLADAVREAVERKTGQQILGKEILRVVSIFQIAFTADAMKRGEAVKWDYVGKFVYSPLYDSAIIKDKCRKESKKYTKNVAGFEPILYL